MTGDDVRAEARTYDVSGLGLTARALDVWTAWLEGGSQEEVGQRVKPPISRTRVRAIIASVQSAYLKRQRSLKKMTP